MSLPDIKAKMTADNARFDRAVDGSSRRVGLLGSGLDRASRKLAVMGDRMKNMGRKMSYVSAGVVVAGGAMFALAKQSADVGNKIDKGAKAAGLSTSSFQELAFALGQVSEVGQDQFANAMTKLTRSMGDAADGVKLPLDAFEKMGISQQELQDGTISTEDAFKRLTVALQNTKSPAEASALAAALLGREGAKLGPILRESGSEIDGLRQKARDLGIVLSGDGVKAAAEFTDKWDEVKRQFSAVKFAIGAALLPVLTEKLLPAIQSKVIPQLVNFAQKIGDVIQWVSDLPGPVQEAAGLVAAALGIGGPVLAAVGAMSSAFSVLVAATGPVGLLIAGAALLAAAWVKWGDDIKAAVGNAVTYVEERFARVLEFISELPAKMAEIGGQMIDGLKQGISERWDALKEYVYGLAENLPQWMRDVLGINSPSRVFAEIGGFIGEGLAQGIAASHGLVNDSVKVLAGGAVKSTKGMVSDVLGSLGQLFEGSKAIAIGQALVNTWQGASEALKLPFPANLAAFAQVAATGLGAVKNIKSASRGGGGSSGSTQAAAPVAAPVERKVSELRLVGQVFDPALLVAGINEAGRRGEVVRAYVG